MNRPYKSECYCTNLRRASNRITEYYNAGFEELGITTPQYYLLINLYRRGESTASGLSKEIGLERSTLVRNLNHLVDKGLVGSDPQGQGRKNIFALTDAGIALTISARKKWNENQKKLEKAIGKTDAEELIRIANKIQEIDIR